MTSTRTPDADLLGVVAALRHDPGDFLAQRGEPSPISEVPP